MKDPHTILGIGTDIIEIDRIAMSIENHGNHFLDRIFTPREQEYALKFKNSHTTFAGRFAAKEAIAKAFGTGIGAQLGWQDIEVRHTASGAPEIRLSGKGAELAAERGVCEILVSLTHTESMAAAQVFLQGE